MPSPPPWGLGHEPAPPLVVEVLVLPPLLVVLVDVEEVEVEEVEVEMGPPKVTITDVESVPEPPALEQVSVKL